MAKIGRNEKCPCGSGRKYKNCCMAKDSAKVIIKSELDRYQVAEKQLGTLIVNYARSEQNETDFEAAIEKFFGGELSEIDINNTEFNFFMSWYIKNYNLDDPFINKLDYIDKSNFSFQMKELLDNLKSSGMYLYKIKDLKNGKIIVENLHTGSEFTLIDEILEQNVNINDVIYTRIYKTDKYYKLFGGSMLLPDFIIDKILDDINKEWDSSDKQMDFDKFLQSYSLEIIKKLTTDISDDTIMYNEDDELLQYSNTVYKILDRPKCEFTLDNIGELYKSENNLETIYKWKKYKNDREIVMGDITISEQKLIFETDSFERKQKLQGLLEGELKDIIEFVDENYFTIRQLKEESQNCLDSNGSDEIEKLILENMKIEYTPIQIRDAILLVKQNKSHFKRLKAESIAAATEYIITTQHNLPKTQKEIADKYNISTTTVAKRAKDIQQYIL